MMPIDYSFVITVKNRQELFDRCLKSVLWQDYPSYEVVVVDYGSEPKLVVSADPRVKLIRLDPEDPAWNHCIAFNAGIANTKGESLAILGCDCILAPDLLSAAHAAAKKGRPNPAGPWRMQVYWNRFDLTPSGQSWLTSLEPFSPDNCFKSVSPKALVKRKLGGWMKGAAYGDFLVVEKAVMVAIGGYDERMNGWGGLDNDMMRRLRCLGYQEYWGKQFKLMHQNHPRQKVRSETQRRNWRISRQEEAAGNIIRNGGPQNFEKYRVEA